MPRFLIEIRHSTEHEGCVRSLDAIVNHGSHLVTQAEFGCEDGVHAGWLIVEMDSRDDALRVVPPQYRAACSFGMWIRTQLCATVCA